MIIATDGKASFALTHYGSSNTNFLEALTYTYPIVPRFSPGTNHMTRAVDMTGAVAFIIVSPFHYHQAFRIEGKQEYL